MSCTGHCCKAFFLPMTPEQMRERLEKERTGEIVTHLQDLAQIADMVIHLGNMTEHEAKERFNINVKPKEGERGDYYTCKNLGDDGRCTIYAMRPRMCSGYPYGKECQYGDCTAENKGRNFVDERRLKRYVNTHIELEEEQHEQENSKAEGTSEA